MGTKQSKIEGVHLSEISKIEESTTTPPKNKFRKRFFPNFHDPRSPFLNRTPILLPDETERSLNFSSDSFSDLFVNNKQQRFKAETTRPNINSGESSIGVVEQTKDEVDPESFIKFKELLNDADFNIRKSVLLKNAMDPRSPSINIERTPILFNDDTEEQNDSMLETILATLSVDCNNSISTYADAQSTPKGLTSNRKTRHNKKRNPMIQISKQSREDSFQNKENRDFMASPCTKGKSSPRTPLSCLKNRQHLAKESVVENMASRKFGNDLRKHDNEVVATNFQ